MKVKALVIKNRRCEDLGTLKEFFDADVIEADEGEHVPDTLEGYEALVILGGPVSAYDDLQYLREEEHLIREAMKQNIPTLGICLGSQLIAKACNARVYKGSKKEIGWYNITLTEEGMKIFSNKEIRVFQWHGDTYDLPEGAICLATSSLYPVQAFKIGSAIGLQFHIEVTKEMILEWMKEYRSELEGVSIDDLMKDMDTNVSNLENYSKALYNKFSMSNVEELESLLNKAENNLALIVAENDVLNSDQKNTIYVIEVEYGGHAAGGRGGGFGERRFRRIHGFEYNKYLCRKFAESDDVEDLDIGSVSRLPLTLRDGREIIASCSIDRYLVEEYNKRFRMKTYDKPEARS